MSQGQPDRSDLKFGMREPEGMWAKRFASHPYTPITERAEGIYIYDEDGNRFIDLSGGPMAIGIGAGDPRVKAAITEQLDKFTYSHSALSNRPAAELCERLSQVMPASLNTTYLTPGGGSDAVETVIKIARNYHWIRKNRGKHIVVALNDAYHGMSLGALSVSGIPGTKNPFRPLLQPWPKVDQYSERDRPTEIDADEWAVRVANQLEKAIHTEGAANVAAFIATPCGVGADYGLFAPESYWRTIREICDANDVLLIADEVVTGFGRTGRWFGMDHYGIEADLMTMGKGITSLTLPLGAVAVSDAVNEVFQHQAFMHGYTNQGHPLSCAASMAVIDILEKDGLVENSAEMGAYLDSKLDRIRAHPTVADVRGRGLLKVMELVADKQTMDFFPRSAQAEHQLLCVGLEHGVVFYSALYPGRHPSSPKTGLPFWIAPPLCVTRQQVDEIVDALDATLGAWERRLGY